MPVGREDLILLLADGAEGPYQLDPIRIMKGCFIISQAGRPAWRELFNFRPYAYGPFDGSVYSARDALINEGLLEADTTGRYEAYALTDAGRNRLQDVAAEVGDKAATWVRRVGRYVTSKSFSRLLDEVYERWPDYTGRSLVRR